MVGKYLASEYKDYLCRLVVDDNRKVSELARELELSSSSLYKWVGSYRKNHGVFKPQKQLEPEAKTEYKTVADFEKEIAERDKEIARLAEQNGILKKAVHVFTKNPE